MRVRIAVLMVVLCVFSAPAFAEITRISPSVVPLGSEEFMSLYGSDLVGTESTLVVYDGALSFEPSNATPTLLVTWIPVIVAITPGEHTVEVHTVTGGVTTIHGPVGFTVAAPEGSGAPVLNLPEVVIAEAESSTGANVLYLASAASSDGTPIPATCTPETGARFPLGTTTVQCSATDSEGTTTGSFTVFVTDTEAPEVTVPEDIESENPVVTFTATATDNVDGTLPVTCSPASGSSFPTGSTRVRCSATDAHANTGVEFFMVRITGGVPLLHLPDDIVADATSPAGAVVEYEASAEEATTFGCTPASGSTFALGATTVTCTASNAAGSVSGTFTVTVVDVSGPILTLPSLVEAEATSPSGAIVTFVTTATDAVDGDRPVDCVPASGTLFAMGTTTVFCTTSDTSGNDTAGSFDVVVADTTGPEITLIQPSVTTLWPPNHHMVPVSLTVSATDAVDPAPVVAIVSVTSNQPVNGTGDGDASPDWIITGPLTLELRAERSGGEERVYTIVVQATDLNGNTTTATTTVRVAESGPPNTRRRSMR